MQVKKKPKKTAKAVPEKSRKKKQPSEDQIKKQPFLKRMLFGEEKPDLSELEAGSTTILDILSPTTVDMQLEEISLDCVIMSPEMLEPVPAREPESTGNLLTLTCLEDQIDHVDGVTLAISNDMGVLLRKMLENLEEYDDPPVLTRVEKTISGFLFAYGGRDNQEDGPCVVYIVSETPVLPAKNKEEMK